MAGTQGIRAGRAFVELFADDSALTRGLARASQKLTSWGAGITSLGTKLLTTGLAAATPFALAARESATFESSMARVKALTNANEREFGALGEEARKLGRDTVFTASQAADAMSFFALAGFKVDEILKATTPTLALAAAGQIEIAQAADISAKILRSMGMAAGDLSGVVDVLAKAMSTANTDMLQLGDAFKFVGPAARAAGFSLEEITAAIQMLSDAGIQGEMAGTTLRGMILTLSDSAKAPLLAKLGVQVRDAQGNFRRLADIVDDFQKSLRGQGTFDVANALGGIFENRQVTGAMTLIAEGADKLRGRIVALEQASGTAGRIASTQLDTLTGSFKILLSAAQDVAIQLGQAITPMLREWGGAAVGALNTISAFIKGNQDLAVSIAQGAAALIAGGVAFIALGASLGVVAFAVSGFAAAFSAAAAAVGLLVKYIAFIATPTGAALKLLDVLLTSVVMLGDYQALVINFARSWEDLKATAVGSWTGILDALKAGDLELAMKIATGGLNVIWLQVMETLRQAWGDMLDGLVIGLDNTLNQIERKLVDFGNWWVTGSGAQADTPDQADTPRKRREAIEAAKAELAQLVAAAEAAANAKAAEARAKTAAEEAARAAAQKRPAAAAAVQVNQVPNIVGGGLQRIGGDALGAFSAQVARMLAQARDDRIEQRQLDEQLTTNQKLDQIKQVVADLPDKLEPQKLG